jgi:transposase
MLCYKVSDYEWTAIKPMLPNKPCGASRVNDRRVLNGICWASHPAVPWRDLAEGYGPAATCHNRFVHWLRAGVWGLIMEALAAAHDTAVEMIDTPIVRGAPARRLYGRQQGTADGRFTRVD